MGVEVIHPNDPLIQIIADDEDSQVIINSGEIVVISDTATAVEIDDSGGNSLVVTQGQVTKQIVQNDDWLLLPDPSSLPIAVDILSGPAGPDGQPGPPGTTSWDGITDKPSTFPAAPHDHNDLYYTKPQVDVSLGNKTDEDDFQSHVNSVAAHGLGDIPSLTLIFENGLI